MLPKHKPLFEPIYIGKHKLKNRIVLAPTHMGHGTERGGRVTDQVLSHYYVRSNNDVGLVIVEATGITGRYAFSPGLGLGAASDKCIPGLSDLSRVIHWGGAKAIIQLTIGEGAQAFKHGKKRPLVGPSDVPAVLQNETLPKTIKQFGNTTPENPTPLTIEEIQDIKNLIVRAAQRAKKADFEGVEIHGAHGYLLSEFTSPFFNRREDEYGGSIKNRHRLSAEIVQEIKSALGNDFIVGYRFSSREHIQGGAELSDAIELANRIQEAGADYISVSRGCYGSITRTFPKGENMITEDAALIKKEVSIPVMCANFHNPDTAAKAVENSSIDLIALSRPLLADPFWAKKVKEGTPDTISQCIRCYQCIKAVLITHLPVRCPVNPSLGFERFDPNCYPIPPQKDS